MSTAKPAQEFWSAFKDISPLAMGAAIYGLACLGGLGILSPPR